MTEYQTTNHVFLGVPNAGAIMPCAFEASHNASNKHKVSVCPLQFGDIEHNFNMLWCESLRARQTQSVTHFAMLHTDIGAVPGWLDMLIEEMEKHDADIMTTVIAIKDHRGLTTTGVRYPGAWGTRRFTMTEIMALPETFSIRETDEPDGILAINTGLWVCRIDRDWVERFPGFTCKHKIEWIDGIPSPSFDSEDWLFSDWAASEGLRVFATRRPVTFHRGAFDYRNDNVWGAHKTDQQRPIRPVGVALLNRPKPEITLETEFPIALDSLDHTQPFGTANDNSVSYAFNKRLFELIPPEKVRLLDLGCAGGGLVRTIIEAGGFAIGLEGSDYSKRTNRAEWPNIPDYLFTADVTKPFTLKNCTADPVKFNVVTGWEFFEHIAREDVPKVLDNLAKHCTDDAIFIGSISQNREPHHRTAEPKLWWIQAFNNDGRFVHDQITEFKFADVLVRGEPNPNAQSFMFGMKRAKTA